MGIAQNSRINLRKYVKKWSLSALWGSVSLGPLL